VAALTLGITILLYPLGGPLRLDLPGWQWAGVALTEVVIGLVMGLAANFVLEAPMLAGQILGVQMGYSLAALFDPNTQAETPVLAQFHQLAALLIFLQCNVHHWLLRAADGIFLAGVQIAVPVLAATLVADVALEFLAKASPQLLAAYWPHSFSERFAASVAIAERLLHLSH
jgi:flagellar biosynthetic protein FliR